MPRDVFEAIHASRLDQLRAEIGATPLVSAPSLVLEIGCGNGHFLTAYAAAHPSQLCVGVDLRLERIGKALRKRDRARADNLFFLRCEVRDFLEVLPAPVRLREIYLLFPDPWPKKRHHKNRLLKSAFLDQLAVRALPDTRLVFRTDYKPYYDEALETIHAHTSWRLEPPGPLPFEHPSVFQSRAPSYHSLTATYVPSTIEIPHRG